MHMKGDKVALGLVAGASFPVPPPPPPPTLAPYERPQLSSKINRHFSKLQTAIYIPLEWHFCQNWSRLISNLWTRATIKFSQPASLISAVASFSKLRRFLAVVSLETRALRKLARSLLILEVLLVAFCSAQNFSDENQLNPLKSPICPPFFFYTEPSASELAVSMAKYLRYVCCPNAFLLSAISSSERKWVFTSRKCE